MTHTAAPVYPTFTQDENPNRKLNRLVAIIKNKDSTIPYAPAQTGYQIPTATEFTIRRTITATSTATEVREFVTTIAYDLQTAGYLG